MGLKRSKDKGPDAAMMALVLVSIMLGGMAAGLVAQRGEALERYEKDSRKGPVVLDFSVVTVDGKALNLSDLRGRPVFLDLMATWCGVCRMQMPMLNETYNSFKDQVVFLSIGMDWFETDEDLRGYKNQYGAQWTFALDRTGEVYGATYAQAYPTLLIIDKDGRMVFYHEGAITQADLLEAVHLVAP